MMSEDVSVTLIFPKLVDSLDRFDESFWLTNQVKKIFDLGKTNFTPPLSLLSLAAVTPSNFIVEIVDERLDKINYDAEVDLVGISVVTRAAKHAYDIADRFRSRGVKVVLGGIHPTVLPNEAILHADAVVIGEGEGVWPELLKDFMTGGMKKFYDGRKKQVENIPIPNRSALKKPNMYLTTKVITATRGCSNTCTFCSAGFAIGKQYRKRPVEGVISEIDSLQGRYLIFMDDNLGCDLDYAKSLFRELKPLKLKWAGAISVSALEDEQLVNLAADSGCISLGVGFESINPETLKAMGKIKTNDPSKYKVVIRSLHQHGIPILGYFILGFDPDTLGTYKILADFIEETSIEMPSINTLIPYPGSPIFRKYEREGRILSKDWTKYDTAIGSVVYQPKNMTTDELVNEYLELTNRVYSYPSIGRRLLTAGYFDLLSFAWSFHYNFQQRQSVAAEEGRNELI